MALLEGRVGPQTLQNGATAPLGLTKSGAGALGAAHAPYAIPVLRGNVFTGGTAATGVAPGTALGTTTAFTLANPRGSGVNLVVLRTSMGYVSGTLGAGVVHYLANTNENAAAVTGTAITVVNCLVGGVGGRGLAFTTATVPVTPTVMRPFASLTALLASTAVQPYMVVDDVAGEFVVKPGCALSLHATAAAGSSPLVVFGMTWEEDAI